LADRYVRSGFVVVSYFRMDQMGFVEMERERVIVLYC
jgi:hypothetical protein